MKNWIPKAIMYLVKSLGKVPSELNEIDWKEQLSPNNDKLCKHISAFANLPICPTKKGLKLATNTV